MGRCLKRWQLSRDLPCWLSLTFQDWSSCFCSQSNETMYYTYSDILCTSMLYCSNIRTSFLTDFYSDVWIIGFVKNKGIAWLKAIFFVVHLLCSYFMFCFCLPCWLNNFSSFVGCRKDNTESLGLHNTETRTNWLWRMNTHGHARSLANNTALSSFIRPMHRCRACSVLMKNNLSKSVVALRQPFSPNITFKGGSLLTHYCSKATEPREAWGN